MRGRRGKSWRWWRVAIIGWRILRGRQELPGDGAIRDMVVGRLAPSHDAGGPGASVRDPGEAVSQKKPRQQNLWVCSGTGSRPRLCSKASLATSEVRKPYDFLVTNFTLLLSPS